MIARHDNDLVRVDLPQEGLPRLQHDFHPIAGDADVRG
jgi:hypothetical protein